MKNFLRIISGTILVVALVLGVSFLTLNDAGATSSSCTSGDIASCSACIGSGGTWNGSSCSSPGNDRTVTGTLQQVGNILIFIVGAISVIMIIVGGIRYALSQGDQSAITAAKNTILYAIIGVVLALASYGIVNFVTAQF